MSLNTYISMCARMCSDKSNILRHVEVFLPIFRHSPQDFLPCINSTLLEKILFILYIRHENPDHRHICLFRSIGEFDKRIDVDEFGYFHDS